MKQNRNNNDSFSLLNQQEIDSLIRFLTEKKNAVDSDVLSQNSIDKLITLIQTDRDRITLSTLLTYGNINNAVLKDFRTEDQEPCQLQFGLNQDSRFAELTIYNPATEKTMLLTPRQLDQNDTEEWGLSIPPSVFIHIALGLELKFTQATYDAVCDAYAANTFGSSDHKIPEIMLPDNDLLVECLL